MLNISNVTDRVPLMFQAQTKGRSQLQFISKNQEQDSQRWASEWTEKAYPHPPKFDKEIQTQTYKMNWRFVSNGGQDEGIIRPVIGAFGLPFYPGSSMKGAFCQACTEEQKQRYRLTGDGEKPSLLRFHGGYPINDWTEKLIDIVHPQQKWQVEVNDTAEKPQGESGFALISLYEPTIEFGISSLEPNTNWNEVWEIWEKALGYGIGCRVSNGYGFPKARLDDNGNIETSLDIQGEILYRVFLKGQGQAPKLINSEESEFRPNIFRASLRGHALRIFSGLTNAETARDLVNTLFGGIEGEGTQGLLGIAFKTSSLHLNTFAEGYNEPTYNVACELYWLLTQALEDEQKEILNKLLRALMRFAMLLGGFGKSWRRADHRIFYEDYYNRRKPLIGCHWKWDRGSLINDNKVRKLTQATGFINNVREIAQEWMQSQGVVPNPDNKANWREAWHSDNVQVWGRIAEDSGDCKAITWLHQPFQRYDPQIRQPELSIKQTSVTGRVEGRISQIGRLWHRMYPIVILKKPEEPNGKPIPKITNEYMEFLTIFPDDSPECDDFLNFLNREAHRTSHEDRFRRLW
ncbi:RAMP superfamily protein [Scytonema sp. UIC 10036]|uniref:RAMP superfamily protein n=1 Tax=Scytonema sp. UIC 10036 TaxID=2304196 RepID=UPI0012DA7EA7|nr:RAMP superfamily protein [Scytonema sp. UIC 10036]MUG97244.1 RAMP superfamily protein [Scytonema sp. UIC 10036]